MSCGGIDISAALGDTESDAIGGSIRDRVDTRDAETCLGAGPAIVLVDDEPLTRASLRGLLEGAGFDVRAEAGDAETAIEACVRERPRLCLVDLNISGGGIRVVREVSQRVPEALVVVLAASPNPTT